MKNKTKELIARIIVILLVLFMVLGMLSPFVFGATTTYKNKNLHMSMNMPSSVKKTAEKVSSNCVEFNIDYYLTIRVTYGNIYEEILEKQKLDKTKVKEEDIFIESTYTESTWNNREYITDYFKSILSDAKGKYSYKIEKTTLGTIPAWKCHYKGKKTESEGEYYLTVNNAGLYILQFDCYLATYSHYKKSVKSMLDSYTITDLAIPMSAEEKAILEAEEEAKKAEEEKKAEDELTEEEKKAKEEAEKKAAEEEAKKRQEEVKIYDAENIKVEMGVEVFGYLIAAVIVLASFIAIAVYYNNKKIDKVRKEKREEIRSETRKKLKVTRKKNDDIDV